MNWLNKKLPTPNIKEINYAELKRAGSTKPDDWDPRGPSCQRLCSLLPVSIPISKLRLLARCTWPVGTPESSLADDLFVPNCPPTKQPTYHLSMNYCFILYSQPQISLTGPRLVTITQIESIPALEKYVQLLYYVRVRHVDVNVEKNNCCTLWSSTLPSHSPA